MCPDVSSQVETGTEGSTDVSQFNLTSTCKGEDVQRLSCRSCQASQALLVMPASRLAVVNNSPRTDTHYKRVIIGLCIVQEWSSRKMPDGWVSVQGFRLFVPLDGTGPRA
jgi:hypothetical protein